MQYVGKKEKKKKYEKRAAIYALIFNANNELAVFKIKNFGYILPGGHDEQPIAELLETIALEIGCELNNTEFYDQIGAYYSVKLNNEIIYCDVKAVFYKATVNKEGHEETSDGHEIVWIKPEAIYEQMTFDFQRYLLEKIIRC
jgi:hypothetical protein